MDVDGAPAAAGKTVSFGGHVVVEFDVVEDIVAELVHVEHQFISSEGDIA